MMGVGEYHQVVLAGLMLTEEVSLEMSRFQVNLSGKRTVSGHHSEKPQMKPAPKEQENAQAFWNLSG